MEDKLQQGLDDLLNYVDNPQGEERGQSDPDLDMKSTDSDDRSTAADQATEAGTTADESNQEAQGGDETSRQEGATTSEEEEEALGEETDELSVIKKELETLRGLLEKQNKPTDEESQAVETPKIPELKPQVQDIELFKDYNFDDIVQDEEVFKKWAKNLVSRVQEVTQEAIYLNVPQLIQSYTEQQISINSRAKKFYDDNPDLAAHKTDVAKNANLIAQADPGLDQDTFFNRVADFTRMQLGIKGKSKEEESVENKSKPKPALNKRSAKASTRMQSAPELAGIEKEIADMLDHIDK